MFLAAGTKKCDMKKKKKIREICGSEAREMDINI
jgi:hypothetical protein